MHEAKSGGTWGWCFRKQLQASGAMDGERKRENVRSVGGPVSRSHRTFEKCK